MRWPSCWPKLFQLGALHPAQCGYTLRVSHGVHCSLQSALHGRYRSSCDSLF